MGYHTYALKDAKLVNNRVQEMLLEVEAIENRTLKQLALVEKVLLQVENRLIGASYSKSSAPGTNQNELK